jgi:hypothetical protein
MAQVYAAKYLAKAALSAPRDLVNAYIAGFRPIHPTVLIFHCTFVCDARCEMCSNWKRGDRKSDLSLEDIDGVFASSLWRNIETANVSGGEPTTRNDLVEICQVMLTRLPRREESADFYTLLLGATLGMSLMASASHLLMLYIGVEMASVPSYAMAGFLKQRRESSEVLNERYARLHA